MSIITGSFGYKADRVTIRYFENSAVLKVPVFEKVYQGPNKDATWNNFLIEIWFRDTNLVKAPEMHELALKHNTVAITGYLESQRWKGNDGEVTTWIIKPFDYWKLDFFTKEIPKDNGNGSQSNGNGGGDQGQEKVKVAPVGVPEVSLEEVPF